MADDLILNMSYVAISISVHKLQRILSNFFMSLAGKTGSMKVVTLNGGLILEHILTPGAHLNFSSEHLGHSHLGLDHLSSSSFSYLGLMAASAP
ncbi:hypothetical protein C4D60_Mb08t13410 [Musa balbisiana]|uniref:Uncharacterized protein n=1 Tax=Musa balbisiana TaxID=52838 RepID=A0A4S8K3H2_MUSBA|nr:hypothetical protein C4D60_Mb08t13410 [Musa balbisiana]